MKNRNQPSNIENPGKQSASIQFESLLWTGGIAIPARGRDEELVVPSLGGEGGQHLNTTSASTPGQELIETRPLQKAIQLTSKREGLVSLAEYLRSSKPTFSPRQRINRLVDGHPSATICPASAELPGTALMRSPKGGWLFPLATLKNIWKENPKYNAGHTSCFPEAIRFLKCYKTDLPASEPNVLERHKQRLGWKEGVFSTLGPIKISKVSKHTTPLNPTEGNGV